MPIRRTLGKREIIRGYRSFSRIIATGQRITVEPIRAFFLVNPATQGILRAGFSVSKGAGAVNRNRHKRLLREAFRTNKESLVADSKLSVEVVFLHTRGRSDLPSTNIAMKSLLEKISKVIEDRVQ